MKRFSAMALIGIVALAVPGIAQAHVSLHPNEVPAGAFAALDIRVPNETDNANTTKLVVQMPPGFTDVSVGDVPGWSAKLATRKLAKPVKTEEGTATEEVSSVTWTGSGSLGKIPPGEFQSFPISVEIPDQAGSALTFKALQYYDDGKVVRWIGPPDSETPAPTVDITAAGGVLQDAAGSEAGPPATAAASTSGSSSDDNSDTLAIVALIVGGLGLLAGGAALIRARRAD